MKDRWKDTQPLSGTGSGSQQEKESTEMIPVQRPEGKEDFQGRWQAEGSQLA